MASKDKRSGARQEALRQRRATRAERNQERRARRTAARAAGAAREFASPSRPEPSPPPPARSPLGSHGREQDIADFVARRRQIKAFARARARHHIAVVGVSAAVDRAMGILVAASASGWEIERSALSRAADQGQSAAVRASARQSLRAASDDAARTSRYPSRDPAQAATVCLALAVIECAPAAAVTLAARLTHRTESADGLADRVSERSAF